MKTTGKHGKITTALMRERQYFKKVASEVAANENMQKTKKLTQHGNVSVFAHSVAVAYYSVKLAKKLGIVCDKRSLIRGAMLHDFFLYDWHKTINVGDGLHGFVPFGDDFFQTLIHHRLFPPVESCVTRR